MAVLTDIDGNVYTSVRIGSLEVLVQNYKATKYADGTPIPFRPNDTTPELLSGWSNIDLTSLTSSGKNITYVFKASQGDCKSNNIDLEAGDTLIFNFTLTKISLNLPRVLLFKNGVVIGSSIISEGANTLNLSISATDIYAVGFRADAGGSEFSVSSATISSNWGTPWADDAVGAYCHPLGGSSYIPYLGLYYNRYAIYNAHGISYIAKDGIRDASWRVMTVADASAIITELGGESVAGGKLKAIYESELWAAPNTGATNESGFTAPGSSYRDIDGSYSAEWQWKNYSQWLDGLIAGSYAALALTYDSASVNISDVAYETLGFTVRLVRDYSSPITPDPPEVGPGVALTVGYDKLEYNEEFNVMYSIGDIRDLSAGSSNKSYTLNIPLTKQNRKILKFVTNPDVKVEPDKKIRLYKDELIIMQGKMTVYDFQDLSTKIMIDSDDWIDILKNYKMSDIDLSAYDHQLTATNVENSWSGLNSDNFYRYPMIDFGALCFGEVGHNARWQPNDFIPMLRVVDLIKKIIPYPIVSNWLDSDYVGKLYILGRESIAEESFIKGKDLDVSGDSASDNQNTVSVAAGASGTAILTAHMVNLGQITKNEIGYDSITGVCLIRVTGTYRFTATLVMTNTGMVAPFSETAGQLTVYMKQSGSASRILATISYPTGIVNGATYTLESGYVYLVEDDEITIELNCYSTATNTGVAPANLTVGLDITSRLICVWNNANRHAGLNQTIDLSKYVPDMTQMDFISAIRDMFNLRFFFDKFRNKVYFEPWDNILSSEVIDLTNKVDFEDKPGEMISTNYSKNILFKWKDDSSDKATEVWLRSHESNQKYQHSLSSLFAKDGTDTREHTFSTVILGYNITIVEYTTQVARIWADEILYSPTTFNRKVNFNTRIVSYEGLTTAFTWYYGDTEKTSYPKISPIDWTELFNLFWKKIFHYLDKGKIYTLKMKINSGYLTQFMTVINDASKEGFRPIYKINIDGSDNYFILQKVTTNGNIAELELIIRL